MSSMAEAASAEGSNSLARTGTRPLRGGQWTRVGLRVKFFVFLSIAFAASGLVFGWIFSGQFEQTLRQEFQKRGEILARGIAANGRLDVWTGDEKRLKRLIVGALEEPDVVAAAVYGAKGETYARAEKLAESLSPVAAPTIDFDVAIASRIAKNGERLLAFRAPVRLQGEVEDPGARSGGSQETDPFAILEPGAGPDPRKALGIVEVVFGLGGVERRIDEVQRSVAQVTIVIVLIGIFLVFPLSRIFVTPIERIAATARRVGAGDRRSRVEVKSRDELGDLADSFNLMTESLADREEELRRMNQGLEQKVRERTAELEFKQHEVMNANLELARASRLKSEFLANMSHELRTPLNAVNGFSELLLEQAPGPLVPKQKRYVENILQSGRHLLQLINDILDLSKIEAGRLELRLEAFSLRNVIENAVSVIQPLAQKKSLAVEVAIAPDLNEVELDPGKMKQILYNLMSNAVKFTDEGKITISATKPETGWLELVVADTGIGIKPDDQSRIFREFEQLDGSHSRRYDGTGLGLALTRKLVELQGGTVRVDSELGRGSRFVVRLPLERGSKAAGS